MKIRFENTFTFLFVIVVSFGNFACQAPSPQKNSRSPIELTEEQKVGDIKFMFRFIKHSSPFRKLVESEFDFADLMKLESGYIKRAKKSKTNKEFIDLIGELIQILEQGNPHAEIMEAQKIPANFDTALVCLKSNITPKAIELNNYWWDELDYYSQDAYADIKVGYEDGEYVVKEDFYTNGETIPKGSVISMINNLYATEYLKSIQHKMWLRLDPLLKIPYASNGSPFSVDADKNKSFWDVEFTDPDNTKSKVLIAKKKGFKNTMPYPMYRENVLCKELNEKTAYLKVFRFPDTSNIKNDRLILGEFFETAKSNYKNLIIDLRGNNGGIPVYGERLLVQPFIQNTQRYIQYAAVKKEIYEQLKKQTEILDSLGAPLSGVNFGQIEIIEYSKLPPNIQNNNALNSDFYYFKTTKLIQPENNYKFEGRIFLLIDNNCFSAAEDIIRIYKELKIGKIVGTNSLGGAAVVLPPWLFEVPNCHLLFTTEVELAFNPDGSINELYGTEPDITMEPSTYPTTFPKSFDTMGLLNDKWIKWIINNEM